mgnify:FL=1
MNIRAVPLIVSGFLLSACVTTTPENLFTIPPDPPKGKATVTGQYPTFEQPPVGATKQLTKAETSDIQAELAKDLERGQALAAANANSNGNAEAAALVKLARERERALREKIEGESSGQ